MPDAWSSLLSISVCSNLQYTAVGVFCSGLVDLSCDHLTVLFLRCMAIQLDKKEDILGLKWERVEVMMGLYLDRMEVLLGIAVGGVAGYDGLAGYEHAGLSVEQDG